MNEFNINLVGKEENIKKEEILNNFDFNYLPMNNLPISYFPFNNPQLSNELIIKDIDSISGIRNEEIISGIDSANKTLTLTANNTIKIIEDIKVDLLLVGGGGSHEVITDLSQNNYLFSSTSRIRTNRISTTNNYYIEFLQTTTIMFNYDLINCEILIVGGGGGGSWYGGGGGGGMVIKIINQTLLKGFYNINIGNGGIGGIEQSTYGKRGNDTTIYNNGRLLFTARGGGGGGEHGTHNYEYPIIETIGSNKYSGGIGGNSPLILYSRKGRLTHVNNNGNTFGGNGGSGYIRVVQDTWKVSGGGGGGAGNIYTPGNRAFNGAYNLAGNGADGQQFDIKGSLVYYGGGGGGGALNVNISSGGRGGGGDGNGNNGINNTGGGGGGGGYYQNGGNGGSGIVIIKFSMNGKNISGGGGGETKYIKDYNLKKGVYDINIGARGTIKDSIATDGSDSYIMKNNNIFLKALGGNKADGLNGGASRKNNFGKGGDGLKFKDNSQFGELINIEGIEKTYGNGGATIRNSLRTDYNYSSFGSGGGINASGNLENSVDGVFILKYKNNDIKFIKRYITEAANIKSSIDLSQSSGHSLETAIDNPNYKLIVYSSTIGSTHTLKLNKDIICDILLVGGGGYGGWLGGGGGGGGVVYKHNYLLILGQYEISIGEGGTNNNGYIGKNTLIKKNSSNILGAGGGGNGGLSGSDGSIITYNSETNSGGGGGGGENNENGNSGNIISGNGGKNNGGGGGAGGNGNNGVNNNGGNGGNGIKNNITGEEKYYGGGGGGSGRRINNGIKGIGVHGGGNGSDYNTRAKNGDSGTGGGGGGQGQESEVSTNKSYIAGFGGSGIVIIRVKKEDIEEGLTKDELYKKIDKDTRIINDIKDEFNKKLKGFYNNDMPYNKFSIFPLVILIILVWLFIFLFLLKFVHHYFINIYLYILLSIIIFLLLFGSMWFLYSNNDL
jgi:hypothetical protein